MLAGQATCKNVDIQNACRSGDLQELMVHMRHLEI